MASNVALAIDILARDKASGVMDKVGSSAENTGKKFGALKKVGVAAAVGVGAALVKFGKDSVGAYSEAEEAQKRLEFAFQKFPNLADTNIEKLRELNSVLQKKTKFDDDAIASGQAALAQFGITGKQLEQTTPLLLDYADATGKDVTSAAQDVGKALLGNAKALKQVGIFYKSTGDPAKDFTNVTALMRKQVGGFAEKEGQTAAGKAAILKNQFGELEETVGSKLLPIMVRATDVGLKVVDWISRNQAVIVPLVAVVGTLVAAIKIWTMAQAALNLVMSLNPIGLVVIGIAALVAGMVVAYKKSETFRNIVNAAFGAVGKAIGFVKDHWRAFATAISFLIGGPIVGAIVLLVTNFGKIKTAATSVWSWVTSKFGALVGFVTGLPGKIKNAAKGMFDGIKDAFRSAVNWLIDKWNGLEFKLPSIDTHIPGVGKVGGFSLGTPDIPRLAKGGIVPKTPGGRLIVAGEGREDEAIVPLSRLGGRGGGDTYIFQLDGVIGSKEQVVNWIETALARKQSSGQKLAFR